jgi:hypothetical protein
MRVRRHEFHIKSEGSRHLCLALHYGCLETLTLSTRLYQSRYITFTASATAERQLSSSGPSESAHASSSSSALLLPPLKTKTC